jgi:hypothetical protein
MTKHNTYFLLLSFLFLFTHCSKEKRIEKNLYSDGGKWRISLYEKEYYNTYTEEFIESTQDENIGYIIFREDKTGEIQQNNSSEIISFTYNVLSDKKIKFHTVQEGDRFYEILKWKKNKLVIISEHYYTVEDTPGRKYRLKFTLQKN